VVVTVSVVMPGPVTLAGLKLQELSLGKPVQDVAAKLMVPVYPVCPVTVRGSVPELPGLLMVRVTGGVPTDKLKLPTVSVAPPEAEEL